MKKRIIAFLLCIALVMPILPTFASATEDITLSATSVTLPQYEKKTITASPVGNVQVSSYQWQINVPGTDLWVDISGAEGATLELSYAMIASLLQGDQAQIRCEAVIGGETVETDVVTVTMDYTSEPAVQTESEPAKPQVLTEATVVESSVSAPAEEEEKIESETVDLAALEEARNAAIVAETDAETAVAAAQEKLTAAQTAEEAAKAALDQAQADYDAAVAAAATAETEEPNPTGETTESTPVVTVDTTALDAAKAAYAAAQAVTAAAQKELDEANAALTAAQAKTAAAREAYEAAEAKAAAPARSAFNVIRRTSNDAMLADADVELNEVYIITIQYILAGTNKQIADPHIAQVIEGQSYKAEVKSPEVAGYTAEQSNYIIDIAKVTESKTYTVIYNPADVNYQVVHKQQTPDLSDYVAVETEHLTGKTGSIVEAVPKDYEGFTYLLYKRPTIAADGSTVVEIKYDRVYSLVNFDLGGGYGVEPIYAPYGSAMGNVGTPSLPGYTFAGWSLDDTNAVALPETVPAANVTYKAIWNPDATAKVTVVIWGENANDEDYSYIKTSEFYAKPGETINYATGNISCGYDEEHTHDESCYDCGIVAHTHGPDCCSIPAHTHSAECCSISSHNHSTACYSKYRLDATSTNNPYGSEPENPVEGQVYIYDGNFTDRYYVYIKGAWYRFYSSTDGLKNGQTISPGCGLEEGNHVHGDGTCDYCDEEQHVHNGTDCNYCEEVVHVHNTACFSCTKVEHSHSEACYISNPGMDGNLWQYSHSDTVTVEADGSSVMNVYYDRTTFSLTFRKNQRTVATITDKWGASISDEFSKAPFNTTYNGRAWKCTETNKYGYALQTLDIMPEFNADFKLYDKSSDSLKTIYYYLENVGANVSDTAWPKNTNNFTLLKTVDTYFNYSTYEEEYHEIEGFTRYAKNVAGFDGQSTKDFDDNNKLYLYYLRNSYSLDFNNGFEETKTETVEYQAELDSFKDYIPPFPEELYEAGSRVFDGWYLNPDCTGDKFVLSEETMPKSNLILYAKWAPVTHEVKIFLREEDTGNPTNQLGETQIVDHRATAKEPDKNKVVNPESEDYEFVGWFYKEGNEEKAFDFSMGVTKDLVLYAKWSTDVEKQFVIYYKIQGTDTEIADRTTGSGPVSSSETFEAKFGDDLNIGYREGYFPTLVSHTITLNIKDNDNEGAHQHTFWYKKTTVPYTVRYLDKNTKEPLLPDKVVTDNTKSYVTETFAPVTGKVPDAYQKSLRLIADTTAEENVIIFYYEVDENRAYYAHTHWIKDINGDWNRISSKQAIGNVGELISAEPRTDLSNYTYDPDLTELVVGDTVSSYTEPEKLTFNGLEIRHYYVENEVDLNYVAVGPVDATGFGSVSREMEEVAIFTGLAEGSTASATDDYEFVGWYDNEECEGEAISTEAQYKPTRPAAGWVDGTTFYAKFQEKEVTIRYEVVGPEGCGTVTPVSETVKVITGNATGSTAVASSNDYKFVGWYSDKDCTNQLSTDAAYVPAKIDHKNIATTYYAKFEYNLTTMTITKSLSNGAYDPQDTFIFDVSGSDGSSFVVTLTPAGGRDSVTIANVTVGVTYTVTERAGGGSNRYTAAATPAAKALSVNGEENVFAFTNTLSNNKWLTATDVKHNVFG